MCTSLLNAPIDVTPVENRPTGEDFLSLPVVSLVTPAGVTGVLLLVVRGESTGLVNSWVSVDRSPLLFTLIFTPVYTV